MTTHDVGNSSSPMPQDAIVGMSDDMELDALFDDITEEFGLIEEAAGDDYDELNAALADAGIDIPRAESASSSRLFDIADGLVAESGSADEAEEFGFIRNFFEKRAKKALKALVKRIYSSRKYVKCIPRLLKVIAAVKAHRWGTAIKEAVATWHCVRNA